MSDRPPLDLEKEALRPGAHKRMAPRLLRALETSVGLDNLFVLRQRFPWDENGSHKQAWSEAFKGLNNETEKPLRPEHPLDRWIDCAARMEPYGALDSACLSLASNDILNRLWRDSCFRSHNDPTAPEDQARMMGQLLKDALYCVPVQWALGFPQDRTDGFSQDKTRNVFRATAAEQKLDLLPPGRQPQSEDEKWQFIAKKIGVKDWRALKGDVEIYKAARGDIDDFEHLVDEAAYDRHSAGPGTSPIDSFGHDRALSAAKEYLVACLAELTEQAPDHARVVKFEFRIEELERSTLPKKRASLKQKALQMLQDCIERKSSNDTY